MFDNIIISEIYILSIWSSSEAFILDKCVTDAVDFTAFISFLSGAAAAAFLTADFIAFIAFVQGGMVKKGRT